MWSMFDLLLITPKQVIITASEEQPSSWKIHPLLKSILLFLCSILVILTIRSHLKLNYPPPLSPGFAPNTAPTLQNLLEVILPSFQRMIYDMLANLLVLRGLTMLFKWPSHFKYWQTRASQSRQSEMGWRKWGWRLW